MKLETTKHHQFIDLKNKNILATEQPLHSIFLLA